MRYKPNQIPFEIPAFLAGGQLDRLGLSEGEAKELFAHYLSLLAKKHGAEALQLAEFSGGRSGSSSRRGQSRLMAFCPRSTRRNEAAEAC